MMRTVRLWLFLLCVGAPLPAAAMTIDRVTSPGGIEAWLVQDHSIPAMALEFTFRGGAAYEPAGKEGVGNLLASMLVEGAGDLPSQRFQSLLEDRSIGLGFNIGLDAFDGNLKTLTENLDTAVDLLRLSLAQPRFDDTDLARVKTRIQAGLRRAAEEPNTIARETWMATAFPDLPYGRPVRGTVDSVGGLTADDLRAFMHARLARDNLIVAVAGDITPAQLAPLLDRVFGALPEKADSTPLPDVSPRTKGQTIVINRNVPQSVVTFGEEGVKRDDPDYYAATLVNYVLGGGGFNSRLTTEVREKRGLAYSVYSYLAPYQYFALLMGGTATENARVAQSIEVIRKEWQRMRDEGPTANELKNAKTYVTGSFPLSLDSTNQIARLLVSMQYDHLGIDYIDKRQALINGVTLADAKRVARRLLDPDRLLTVVVGQPAGMSPTAPSVTPDAGGVPAAGSPAPVPAGRGG